MTLSKSFYQFLVMAFVFTFGISLTVSAQETNKQEEQKLFDFGKQVLKTVQKSSQQNNPSNSKQEQPQNSNSAQVQNSSNPFNVPPKKAGNIRFGIVSAGGDTASDAHSLAATVKFLEILDGKEFAPYDTVLLETKMPHFIDAEAAKKQCDYILYIEDVTNKKKINSWDVIRNKIPKTIPFISNTMPSDQYWKVYRSGQKVMNASDLMTAVAGNTKAKDTTSITYKLVNVNSKSEEIPSTKVEKKATKNGENILESLVLKIGEEVLSKIVKQ